ncbi:MAG: membrane integrity-associated transporter subunit PqiC [Methylococcaceae bacterium]|nr:MAG: membrane integrity-associated transporter subunit PqiC [Methylococcaceae bacterium]
MVTPRPKFFISLLAALMLGACSTTPPTHFYVLDALPQTERANKQALAIGIGPITLPALLERKQMVTRLHNNTVQLAEFHQWAEPLKDTLLRVIVKNLAALQPTYVFRAYPWSAYGNVDYRIIIDIDSFAAETKKNVKFSASWAIMDERQHTIIKNGKTQLERILANPAPAAIAEAMSQLLSQFSQRLIQDIELP